MEINGVREMKMPLIIVIAVFLTACAAPQVETGSIGFDQAKYHSDLNDCRGGSILVASAENISNTALGSLWGAFHGAPAGALAGDGWEGAAIGAVVGATLGLGAGAKEAIEKHDAKFTQCLRDRGYVLVGS
jgi:outer membrane lipoprotein SlyB